MASLGYALGYKLQHLGRTQEEMKNTLQDGQILE